MNIPEFARVGENVKEYRVDNFKNAVKTCYNAVVGEKTISVGYGVVSSGKRLPAGLRPVRIYCADGKNYFYCTDGKIYREDSGSFTPFRIPSLPSAPHIFALGYDGEDSVAVTSDYGAYIFNGTFNYVAVPKADTYAVYRGVLLSGKGAKITVCRDLTRSGFNPVAYQSDYIALPFALKGLKKLVALTDGAYAVCLRGIAKITVSAEDSATSVKELALIPMKVEENSVATVGDKIYFVSTGSLTEFDGKKAEKIPSLLDKTPYFIAGSAVRAEDLYILPVSIEGESAFYYYDAEKKEEGFISGANLVSEGGTTVDADGDIGCVRKSGANSCEWQSERLTFSEESVKCLSAVALDVSGGTATLSVIADDGIEKTLNFSDGENEKRVYARSRGFKFKILFSGANTVISGLKTFFKE